jgi:hypothetical protein
MPRWTVGSPTTLDFDQVTSSGDLTLAGGSVRRLQARTVSGQINAGLDLDLDRDGRLRVGTVSGPITLLRRAGPAPAAAAASRAGGAR